MSNVILDMSLGNPEFLHPYWAKQNTLAFLDLSKDLNYRYKSMNSLKHAIKLLHQKLKNADVSDCQVVIGNGVTQLLNGLINISSNPLVHAEPPYYYRFTEFAKLNNKTWINHENALKLATLPNNPDGKIYLPKGEAIYDLNYNWPQYTMPVNYKFDVMVFGLSKALGLASARIGWALIKDKNLANKLEKYVEYTTGGVSIYSQKIANRLIKQQLIADTSVFQYGKKILDKRWNHLWFNVKLPFTILNSSGLFLWCEGVCPSNLKGVSGSQFGETDDKFRLNLGIKEQSWELFKELYAIK